jgi:uncharacterized OsmC-like protein
MNDGAFTVDIEQVGEREFRVRFEGTEFTHGDPAQLLASAIGSCLSASLAHCLRKSRVEAGPVKARVTTRVARADRGKMRVAGVEVELDAGVAEEDRERARRCVGLFEDYCTVTQSVREGFPIGVSVKGMA